MNLIERNTPTAQNVILCCEYILCIVLGFKGKNNMSERLVYSVSTLGQRTIEVRNGASTAEKRKGFFQEDNLIQGYKIPEKGGGNDGT